MKIYCRHGVEAALLIQSSIDLEQEAVRTHLARPICDECLREMVANLALEYAQQKGD